MTADDKALVNTLELISEYDVKQDTVAWSTIQQLLDIIKRQEDDLVTLANDRLEARGLLYVEA